MLEGLGELNPALLALLAGLFTWSLTALGAASVLVKKEISKASLDGMLGFAGGVMIAASFWSLLAPSIALSEEMGGLTWLPASVGFMLGGTSLFGLDRLLPHLHIGYPQESAEGPKSSFQRATLLVMAITMHNIPEGLAVGVAFGAVAAGIPGLGIPQALALTVGIGLQNLPEGLAVSVPLRREGFTPLRSFFFGQLSGMVEPLAAVIGAAAVLIARPLLPYALAFAAGAMIFVVVEEVIPESQFSGNADLATMSLLAGFTLMMVLDVSL
ncbi:MAG: ZIP family metal transporter [Methanomicrobiales archaeon]|nr:ZIP family metal transporter [Methanomicrobiales archaeon]